jgi:peptidoglycan hydrolase CwlO-like protein
MEVKQMMVHLLAKIRTNREEMRAGQHHLKEQMRAVQ